MQRRDDVIGMPHMLPIAAPKRHRSAARLVPDSVLIETLPIAKKERGRLIPSYFLRFENHHDRIRRTVWYTDLYEIFITVRRSDRAAQMAKVIRYFPDQPDSNARHHHSFPGGIALLVGKS